MVKELIFTKFANKDTSFKNVPKHYLFRKKYMLKKASSSKNNEKEKLFFDKLKICLNRKKDAFIITFYAKRSVKNINAEMYFFDPNSNFKIISRKIDITKNTWFSHEYPTNRYKELEENGLYRTVYFQMNDNSEYQTEKLNNFLIQHKESCE